MQDRSPYRPPLNGAEVAQREFPSSTSILRSSPRDPEMPIFSPIPTRSRPPQVVKAGFFTPNMTIGVESTSCDVLAGIRRGPSTEVAAVESLRHLSSVSRHRHKRLETEVPRERQREKQRKDQEHKERRARKHQERRLQASSADALADSLSQLSTNEREQNEHEENRRRPRRQDRKNRARQDGRAWDHGRAGDGEQSIRCRAEAVDLVGDKGSATGTMDTDVQGMDITSVYGGLPHRGCKHPDVLPAIFPPRAIKTELTERVKPGDPVREVLHGSP